MYLYQNFCYVDEAAVIDAISSMVQLNNGGLILAVTSPATGQIQIQYDNNGSTSTHTFALAECDRLGFNQSFFGITEADAVDLSWLGIGVLVIAWGAATLRAMVR